MAKIMFPDIPDETPESKKSGQGLALLISQSIKALSYLELGIDKAVIKKLLADLNNPDVLLYVTDAGMSTYDLVAFNKQGDRHCYQVECNEGLAITSLSKIKPEALSVNSQQCCIEIKEKIKSTHETEPAPTAPRPR